MPEPSEANQTPQTGGERVQLASLGDEERGKFYQWVGQNTDSIMPAGPSPTGSAFFILIMVDPDEKSSHPLPYVTNAEPSSFAHALQWLGKRFGSKNPGVLSQGELVADALRKLSAAVEEYHDPHGDHSPAALERRDDARVYAINVLDAITPDGSIKGAASIAPDRIVGDGPGVEIPHDWPMGSPYDSKVPPRAVPVDHDREPFRTRPAEDGHF